MNLKIVLKRLILIDLLILFSAFVAVFFESEKSIQINESLPELSDTYLFFAAFIVLSWLISLYLLYKFKNFGKKLYLYLFIINIFYHFFGGIWVADPIIYVIDGLSWACGASILTLIYFSPIKKEFKN